MTTASLHFQGITLPATAWQQAAIICVFAVVIAFVLVWVSKENAAARRFQKAEAEARERAQTARDAEWRAFLTLQRQNDDQKNEAMTESLNALTAATQALVQEVQGQRADFQTHDRREWARLDEMSATIHAGKRPRSKPTDTP